MYEESLQRLERDLIKLEKGDSRIFDYRAMNALQIARAAKSLARRHKIIIRVEPDYEGLRITRVHSLSPVSIGDALAMLKDGQKVRIRDAEGGVRLIKDFIGSQYKRSSGYVIDVQREGASQHISRFDLDKPTPRTLETVYLEQLRDLVRRAQLSAAA